MVSIEEEVVNGAYIKALENNCNRKMNKINQLEKENKVRREALERLTGFSTNGILPRDIAAEALEQIKKRDG